MLSNELSLAHFLVIDCFLHIVGDHKFIFNEEVVLYKSLNPSFFVFMEEVCNHNSLSFERCLILMGVILFCL